MVATVLSEIAAARKHYLTTTNRAPTKVYLSHAKIMELARQLSLSPHHVIPANTLKEMRKALDTGEPSAVAKVLTRAKVRVYGMVLTPVPDVTVAADPKG